MFKVIPDPNVAKFINKLTNQDRAKIQEYIQLFERNGFLIGRKYIKKIDRKVWELRPDKYRLFLFELKPNYIIIHAMYKKSQKITRKTMKTIRQKIKDYYVS